MPEAGEQPAKPADGSRSIYAWWAVGLGGLLLLGFFCWLFLKPGLEVRRVIVSCIGSNRMRVEFPVLRSDDESYRAEAIERLGGPLEAVRKLRLFRRLPAWFTEYGSHPDDLSRREWAVLLLGNCGEPGVRELLPMLQDRSSAVRFLALMALFHGEPEAKAAIPAVERLLADDDADIRQVAAYTLKKLRGEEPARP